MYLRLTHGVIDKGRLIPANANLAQYIDPDKEYYVSPYYYNQEHKARYERQGGSVAGIRDVVTDKLWWDFDDAKDPERARKDTLELCQRLIAHDIRADDIFIAFSGRKGFDVTLQTDVEFNPDEVKAICSRLAEGLPTFDTSLYDSNQIFRVTGTKHKESGLYKIPLTYDDLVDTTVEEIKKFAVEPIESPTKTTITLPKSIRNMKETVKADPPPPSKEINHDLNKRPKWMHPTKWALQQGLYEEGEGNEARMILAATYKAQGLDRDMTESLLLLAEERRSQRLGVEACDLSELERTVLDVVYGPFWTGGQYSIENNDLLKLVAEREDIALEPIAEEKKPIRISDVAADFREFAKNIDKNRIKTGIEKLDKKLILTTGMPWGIIGAPGSGKSSLVIDMLKYNSDQNINCLFASLDLTKKRLYEKITLHYLSKEYGQLDLYDLYKNDSEVSYQIDAEIAKEYKNVYLFSQASPSTSQLSDYIKRCEDSIGDKIKFVVIDYFERIQSELRDDTAASKDTAGRLQDLVEKHDISLCTLFQPRKMSGDLREPIVSYNDIKGSSFIAQSARVLLSIYREGYDPREIDNDRFLTVNAVKNDLGETFSMDFHWDGRYGKIAPLTRTEDFNLLRSIRNKKELGDEDGGFGGFGGGGGKGGGFGV